VIDGNSDGRKGEKNEIIRTMRTFEPCFFLKKQLAIQLRNNTQTIDCPEAVP